MSKKCLEFTLLRNYFCLKMISKIAPQKYIQILEAWKPTKDMKLRLLYMPFCTSLFALLNAYKPKTKQIKALNSVDFSRSYGRLSQNPEALENYFCLEIIFFQILEPDSKFISSRFWSPGNQPKTWNLDLNFFSHALLHMNSL